MDLLSIIIISAAAAYIANVLSTPRNSGEEKDAEEI